MRFSLKTSKQTYGLELGRTVRSVTGDFILTSRLIAPIFLFYNFFDRDRTNRRFSKDLENPDHFEYSETLYDPSEF
jgi:hypothetical protein